MEGVGVRESETRFWEGLEMGGPGGLRKKETEGDQFWGFLGSEATANDRREFAHGDREIHTPLGERWMDLGLVGGSGSILGLAGIFKVM